MEMKCEETAVESCLPARPREILNADHETVEDHVESETCETNQVQSNFDQTYELLVPTEESHNLTNTETPLESSVTPNKTDFLTSSQSHVSLR